MLIGKDNYSIINYKVIHDSDGEYVQQALLKR